VASAVPASQGLPLQPGRQRRPINQAIVEVGDDGTEFGRFTRSTDHGANWQVVRPVQLRGAFVAWAAVEPSGNLLVYLIKGFSHGSLPRGLYESEDGSWTHFHAVVTSPSLQSPHPSPNDGGWLLLATSDGQGRQSLYLTGGGYLGDSVLHNLVSTDEGRTWKPTRTR